MTRQLAWGGSGWHVVKFAIALGPGIAAGSVALVGFALDNVARPSSPHWRPVRRPLAVPLGVGWSAARSAAGDRWGFGVVSLDVLVCIWQGMTPDGYSLVVERDRGGEWVATVASVSRSRSASLEAALVEAGGASVPRRWAAQLAAALVARSSGGSDSEQAAHTSHTGAA